MDLSESKPLKSNRKFLTQDEQAKLQAECDHIGSHTAPAQTMLMGDEAVFIIITHICSYCGATILNNQMLPVSVKKSPIANIH